MGNKFIWILGGLSIITLLILLSWHPKATSGDVLQFETQHNKIRSTHFFGRTRNGVNLNFTPLTQTNVENIVLVPYAYQESHQDAELQVRELQRSGSRRDSTFRNIALAAKDAGLSVTFKPHIWMRTDSDKWRSDIEFTSDSLENLWGDRYRDLILRYAEVSEEVGAPYYCIGAELTSLTFKYPGYWRELIRAVRKVYSGKIFYAANWYLEYEQIDFWDELDMIGVQAYFPLTKNENPSKKDVVNGWKSHKSKLRAISRKYNKPILFSEVGYRSTSCAAIHPWEWVDDHDGSDAKKFTLSLESQATCYDAFFETFWKEDWFAGAMIWQWRGNHTKAGGPTNVDFTPQNKPAQQVIEEWYGK